MFLTNQNLDIDALGIDLNNEELLGNKEYINYLRTVILYKYFKNERRPSFSKQFDFINDNETVVSGETKLGNNNSNNYEFLLRP